MAGKNLTQEQLDSCLFAAVRRGNTAEVQVALDAGADIEARDGLGNTVLLVAALYGDVKVVRALIKAGAYIDSENNDNSTALMIAAHFGHELCVYDLLDEGADVLIKNKSGQTAATCASNEYLRGMLSNQEVLANRCGSGKLSVGTIRKRLLELKRNYPKVVDHLFAEMGYVPQIEKVASQPVQGAQQSDGSRTIGV